MLAKLNSLLRSSSPATSSNTSDSTSSPSATSSSATDQFPFPTSPARVRKARHNNHPQYLPRPDASVRDVQFFLYTLLTSKAHDCAKRYPEWVLETCMGWNGNGERLRNCTEEELASLCPYQAMMAAIDSQNHQPGAFVPIPARHMIGQVIARFVLEKRSKEQQATDVQRRLEDERKRSALPTRSHPSSGCLQNKSMRRPRRGSSASRHLRRAQPITPSGESYDQLMSGFDFGVCSEPMIHDDHGSRSATVTRTFSGPSSLDSQNTSSYEGHYSSASPVSMVTVPEGSTGSASDATSQGSSPRQQASQRRRSIHVSREMPSDVSVMDAEERSTMTASLPSRYAPRRPSGLRASSTTERHPNSSQCNTVPSPRGALTAAAGMGTALSERLLGPLRRRNSVATSKLAIPEPIKEDGERNERTKEQQDIGRHDSGVEANQADKSSSGARPAVVAKTTDTGSSEAVPPIPKILRSATVGPELLHTWSTPRPHNTLPLSKQLKRSLSAASRSNPPDMPLPPLPPLPRPSPVDNKTELPLEDDNSKLGGDEVDSAKADDLAERLKAIEAEYHKMKAMRDEMLTQLQTPSRHATLRKAQSDRTLYSSLDPMQGISAGHKPWQIKPATSPMPPKPEMPPQVPQITKPRQLTLIEIIEEREKNMMKSSKMQELQRRRHADGAPR